MSGKDGKRWAMDRAPIIIAGATASGKSDAALALAERVGGEIVSVDSMQVYRGLDIGTAKPSLEERARAPHHLIDVVELSESFDAARFVAMAGEAMGAIQARGRVPILCGGTGLYFNALRSGLGSAPAPDSELRATLEATSTEELLSELARVDFATFDEIDLQNRRRIVRAVEVYRLTGRPFSSMRASWGDMPKGWQGRAFGIVRDRADLVGRIERRVDGMLAKGLVEETRGLLGRGLERNATAMQAIGYRQVVEHLRGEIGPIGMRDRILIKTRQFSRRQGTWFRGQMDLDWLEVGMRETGEEIAERILARLGRDI